MSYGPVIRVDGKVTGVQCDIGNGFKACYEINTPQWKEFLAWNAQQIPPLNVLDQIVSIPPIQKLDGLPLANRKLAAVIKILDIVLTNAQKQNLPQWIKDELADALQKINQTI